MNKRMLSATAVIILSGATLAGLVVGCRASGQAGVNLLGVLPAGWRAVETVSSGDGLRLAQVIAKDDKQRVVIDGRPDPEYDSILPGGPVFSPDGRRIAYAAQTGGRSRAVIDGKPGPEYDGVLAGTPVFSSDGGHVAYAARSGDKWLVVADGRSGPEVDTVNSGPVFQSDGSIGYLAMRSDSLFRVRQ